MRGPAEAAGTGYLLCTSESGYVSARNRRRHRSPVDAAKVRWWTTELQGRAIDACGQLPSGYGYMLEYPIAKAWIGSRTSRIDGGTTEIIGRSFELG
ncbi:hypothetical protein GCM10022222_39060 [Amycolatopsis ultiminotia]|uniref:Acyl-CoA dehydrogenase/oxidase C-terminal domain-containing protein n=1 Tax=Amycolatopsis ultiminotia TaxID=543629 RepID=A0ABP6WH66_9PSEU